jgi:hypothetical protein
MTAATKIGTGNDELLCIIRDRDQDVIRSRTGARE